MKGLNSLGCSRRPYTATVSERVERKVVTILFCDLVGFTSKYDLADPEDVQQALAVYHARVLREIERFGGTAEKFIGDAVMAVYGAPVAHEDDAQRALLSALRIPPAIEELNETDQDLSLAVRLGVETGEAVVTFGAEQSRQGIAIGDVVNTASRLQGVAPTGGVVVGERTYVLTQDQFDFDPLEPVKVKGKAAPLRIWLAKSARSRFGAELQHGPSTPLVDREDELELLKRTFARAVREPSVQLVTLLGEPGVGKSRLAREFFTYIDDRPELVSWRQGRCLPYGEGVTFWALGQIVKAQAGILESDDAQETRDKLIHCIGGLVQGPREQEWIRTRLAPLVGLAEPQAEGADRGETFSAWRSFLEAIASQNPLVIAIEDLHWADTALLGFVEHLAEWSTGVPILILCSARPDLFERDPRWGGGKRNTTTISLPPLSDADTERLISSLLPSDALPKVRDALIQRAGGNPLFAEEFVRMLLDRSERTGVGSVDATVEIQPPESLNAIIAARLDALPTEQKVLLQDASIVGKVFWPGALSAIGGSEPDIVRMRLRELTRNELVRPVRDSSVRDELEYSFSHALIRDVAYGQIPRGLRADKHVAAAVWIEGLAGERVSEYAELLAHHYGQALELATSAGKSDTSALGVATRRNWVLAGDRAMNLDVARAEDCFEQALRTIHLSDPDRARVLTKRAEANFYLGRYQDAQRNFEEALIDFREQGDLIGAGSCLDWLSTVQWEQGDIGGSRTRLLEAVESLEKEPPGAELADCYASVASERLLIGHFDEAIEWSERSLDVSAKVGMERCRPRALCFEGTARCFLGDLGGLDDLREAIDAARKLGLSRQEAYGYVMVAEVVWAAQGPTPALAAVGEGADLAERRGLSEMVVACHTASLGPLFDLGRWDELLSIADSVIERTKDSGGGYATVMTLPWKAQVHLWRGEMALAESASSDLLSLARRIREPQVLVPAFAAAALVSLHKGEVELAARLLGDLDGTSDVRIDWYREQCIADLIRSCAGTGDTSIARRFLDRSKALTVRHRCSLLAGRAVLAEALGEIDDATRAYEEAVRGWTEYGHMPETGHALLGAGRCLARLGHSNAGDRLRHARVIFEGLGAALMMAEVDTCLR